VAGKGKGGHWAVFPFPGHKAEGAYHAPAEDDVPSDREEAGDPLHDSE